MTYLSDLLAQHPRLDNHPLAVRGLPESAGERVSTPLLQTDTDSEVLNTHAEEELIAKEGPYDSRDAGA